MTLGQLAQELEKSANSLANTLRQVGLADVFCMNLIL